MQLYSALPCTILLSSWHRPAAHVRGAAPRAVQRGAGLAARGPLPGLVREASRRADDGLVVHAQAARGSPRQRVAPGTLVPRLPHDAVDDRVVVHGGGRVTLFRVSR